MVRYPAPDARRSRDARVTPRRLLFVAFLAALLIIAVAVGNANARSAPKASASTANAGVWFCPGLPPQVAVADQRMVITNTGDAATQVVATVIPDAGAPVRRTFQLGPYSVLSQRRSDVGPAGAVNVETFGGHVVVEEGVDGASGIDSTPCATDASANWYFPAGSTARGVQQWLVLDDPYATDAKVDVTLRTNNGVERPDQLQGVDVASRSRVVIPIHTVAVRDDRVAVEVDARFGRVVAAQTLVYGKDAGTPGIALTIGAAQTASRWQFAGGVNTSNTSAWVALINTGEADAQVDVQAIPETNDASRPVSVTVGQDDVTWVPVGACTDPRNCVAVPAGVQYALDVHATSGAAIVAEMLTRANGTSGDRGATTTFGAAAPATTWRFAQNRVSAERETTVALFNPFAAPARVDVALASALVLDHPPSLQGVIVPGGKRVTVTILSGKNPPRVNAGIVVQSGAPVIAQRSIVGDEDQSSSIGVAG
jgi:hypothetical protein